jgi:monodehydroascorbate reductase (NADH)
MGGSRKCLWISGAKLSALMCCFAQVTTTVLKSGEKIESDIVLVGVGARPNVELFKGQIELLEQRPGGIKVSQLLQKSS